MSEIPSSLTRMRVRPQSLPPRRSIYDDEQDDEIPAIPPMPQANTLVLRQRIPTSGSLHGSDISSRVTGKEALDDRSFLFEDASLWLSVSQDSLPIRNRVWGDLSNRQLPHELPELVVRRLEKADGAKIPRIQRSYVNGLLYKDILEWAV